MGLREFDIGLLDVDDVIFWYRVGLGWGDRGDTLGWDM